MSVLLLTNPFATPQTPPPSQPPEVVALRTQASTPVGPQAVQPSQQSGAQPSGKSATAYDGSGAGAGGAAAQQPIRSFSTVGRQPDADRTSVVNAQVAERNEALRPVGPAALSVGEAAETDPDAPLIKPAPDLPDPLPTSPFLKPTGS
ncbi:MAG: hypothetical protein AB8B60_18775 [Sulfitobacter sp.]